MLNIYWRMYSRTLKFFYYMAGCASGQDEPIPGLWLATRAGKMEISCRLGIARCVPARKIFSEAVSPGFSFVISAQVRFETRKKIFRSFFLSMESENKTAESLDENENRENLDVDEFRVQLTINQILWIFF